MTIPPDFNDFVQAALPEQAQAIYAKYLTLRRSLPEPDAMAAAYLDAADALDARLGPRRAMAMISRNRLIWERRHKKSPR